MSDHRFRFGVVATPQDGDQWRATAQRVAELGYSTLLMPDGLQLLSPFPALATAAATAEVRVGTFVLAAPLRPPRSAAWEAHSLTVLTGGRFEFGIGTGLPRAATQAAQELACPCGPRPSGSPRSARPSTTSAPSTATPTHRYSSPPAAPGPGHSQRRRPASSPSQPAR